MVSQEYFSTKKNKQKKNKKKKRILDSQNETPDRNNASLRVWYQPEGQNGIWQNVPKSLLYFHQKKVQSQFAFPSSVFFYHVFFSLKLFLFCISNLFCSNVVGVGVGLVDAPVVLNGPVLDRLPDLAVVAGSLGLLLVPLVLNAGPWGRGSGAGAGGGGGDAGRVVDRVCLVHLLVVLLDGVPGLGGVGGSLLLLFLRHGDGVVAGWLS